MWVFIGRGSKNTTEDKKPDLQTLKPMDDEVKLQLLEHAKAEFLPAMLRWQYNGR